MKLTLNTNNKMTFAYFKQFETLFPSKYKILLHIAIIAMLNIKLKVKFGIVVQVADKWMSVHQAVMFNSYW